MKTIEIILTSDEYARLIAAAREAGFSDASSFVKILALSRAAKVPTGK